MADFSKPLDKWTVPELKAELKERGLNDKVGCALWADAFGLDLHCPPPRFC